MDQNKHTFATQQARRPQPYGPKHPLERPQNNRKFRGICRDFPLEIHSFLGKSTVFNVMDQKKHYCVPDQRIPTDESPRLCNRFQLLLFEAENKGFLCGGILWRRWNMFTSSNQIL